MTLTPATSTVGRNTLATTYLPPRGTEAHPGPVAGPLAFPACLTFINTRTAILIRVQWNASNEVGDRSAARRVETTALALCAPLASGTASIRAQDVHAV